MKIKITREIYTFTNLYTNTSIILHFLAYNFAVIWITLPTRFKAAITDASFRVSEKSGNTDFNQMYEKTGFTGFVHFKN